MFKRSFFKSLSTLTRLCSQSLAILLVLFALGVSLVKGLLPQLDEARQHVVDYLASEYHINVQVGQLSAEWQAFGPSLTVSNIVLPNQQQLPLHLSVGKAKLKLDFWESLFTLSHQIEDVIFDDIHVDLNIDELSESSNQNSIKKKKITQNQLNWLYALLLEQLERFSINDVTVQLYSLHHKYRPIHIKSLHWLNQDGRHRGQGALYLDQYASKHEILKLNVDLKGDGNKPESIEGQIYLAAKNLDLGKWASRQPNPYVKTKEVQKHLPLEGVVNLQAWIDMKNQSIDSGLIQFLPSYLEWKFNDQLQSFAIKSGQFSWKRTDNGWQAVSDNLHLLTDDREWPTLNFYAEKKHNQLYAEVNKLLPANIFPLMPVLPFVDAKALSAWKQLNPQGEIGPIKIHKKGFEAAEYSADVKNLQWQPAGIIPGLSPFSAHFGWVNNQFHFKLPQQKLTINYPYNFEKPLAFDEASLSGSWNNTLSSLQLSELRLNNQTISVDAKARIDLKHDAFLALSATTNSKNAANIGRYYPAKAMGENLAGYLKQALIKGQIADGKLVWNGALNQFPYNDKSGVFQAGFTLDKSAFAFQQDWPAVTDLSLNALFENQRMDLWLNQGKLQNIDVANAHIYIPKMGPKTVIKVDANINTSGANATQLLNDSSLASSVGAVLNTVQVRGPVSSKLNLSIPLYDGGKANNQGIVNLNKAEVNIKQPGILLTNVKGNVSFKNTDVDSNNITAELYNQPISLAFNTKQFQKNTHLDLTMNGVWDLNHLPQTLANPLTDYYKGSLKWSGNLAMMFDSLGYSIHAKVNSNLNNVALNLPAPYTKSAEELMPLSAELIGDNISTHLGIKLDNKAEFWGGFNEQSGNHFAYYDLMLGRLFEPIDSIKKDGGHLWLNISHGDLNQWMPIIKGFLPDTPTHNDEPLFPPLKGVEGSIDDLVLFGQNWHKVTVKAAPTKHAWRFACKSNEFDGRLDFYPNWFTQGVKLVANKLYLSSFQAKADGDAGQVTHLPPLAIDVNDFRFEHRKLGHLSLQGTPDEKGYHIQTFSLAAPGIDLTGNGHWRKQHGENVTALDMSLKADKFDKLTNRLLIDPGVKDAPLDLKAQISWQGAPFNFALDSLNGKVQFQLGKGHLSQISDKGARIFSLFSLDSLLRKLSLDFSDVFGKGLYFNSFNGNLNIDNGVVKTTDTQMDAIAGNMKVRGYTNLSSESLNYDIRFVPQLASSVPTVVLLSTSAWTLGLGAFALTKVLEPMIEIISEIRFRLTGTMTSPHLEEISRKSKEIEIPSPILPKTKVKSPVTKNNRHLKTPDLIKMLPD